MTVKRLLILAAAFAILLLHNLSIRPWMLDDAFISFRYAENLAAGNGPVYNAGEHVEGYTCFLWVGLLGISRIAGVDTPTASVILGSVFATGTLLLLFFAHRFSNRITTEESAISALFAGTCGAFTPWASSGMEVTLFSFLALLAVLLALSNARCSIITGIVLACLALARPEGILIAGILLFDLLLRRDPAGTTLKSTLRTVMTSAIVFCAIYVPYFLWRWHYYGFLLPNTFYAKVGSTSDQALRGLRYLIGFLIVALPLVALFVCSFRRSWHTEFRGALLVVAAYATYVVLVGGDIMPAFRFFAPVAPILCLVAAHSIQGMGNRRIATLVAVLTVAYGLLQIQKNPSIHDYILADTVALDGKEAGLWLREHAGPKAVLATNTGGSVPYYSRLRTIDMLGLNDAHIAHREIPWIGKGPAGHEKGDGAYVLSRKPDYIQFGSSLGDSVPRFLSDQELWQLPEFHRQYEKREHRLPSGKSLILFERREDYRQDAKDAMLRQQRSAP